MDKHAPCRYEHSDADDEAHAYSADPKPNSSPHSIAMNQNLSWDGNSDIFNCDTNSDPIGITWSHIPVSLNQSPPSYGSNIDILSPLPAVINTGLPSVKDPQILPVSECTSLKHNYIDICQVPLYANVSNFSPKSSTDNMDHRLHESLQFHQKSFNSQHFQHCQQKPLYSQHETQNFQSKQINIPHQPVHCQQKSFNSQLETQRCHRSFNNQHLATGNHTHPHQLNEIVFIKTEPNNFQPDNILQLPDIPVIKQEFPTPSVSLFKSTKSQNKGQRANGAALSNKKRQNSANKSSNNKMDTSNEVVQDSTLVLPKPKNSHRRNAWGPHSYADLITKAILSSSDKRLTLSQVYEWMVENIPWFKDKGDSTSSAGWKNSIRHNLSLHSRFIKVQNEGSGKSSWWIINPDAAKLGRCSRRRTSNGSTAQSKPGERKRGRSKKKVENNLTTNPAVPNSTSSNNLFTETELFHSHASIPVTLSNTIPHMPESVYNTSQNQFTGCRLSVEQEQLENIQIANNFCLPNGELYSANIVPQPDSGINSELASSSFACTTSFCSQYPSDNSPVVGISGTSSQANVKLITQNNATGKKRKRYNNKSVSWDNSSKHLYKSAEPTFAQPTSSNSVGIDYIGQPMELNDIQTKNELVDFYNLSCQTPPVEQMDTDMTAFTCKFSPIPDRNQMCSGSEYLCEAPTSSSDCFLQPTSTIDFAKLGLSSSGVAYPNSVEHTPYETVKFTHPLSGSVTAAPLTAYTEMVSTSGAQQPHFFVDTAKHMAPFSLTDFCLMSQQISQPGQRTGTSGHGSQMNIPVDLDLDNYYGAFECDMENIIKDELNVEGSLDFSFQLAGNTAYQLFGTGVNQECATDGASNNCDMTADRFVQHTVPLSPHGTPHPDHKYQPSSRNS